MVSIFDISTLREAIKPVVYKLFCFKTLTPSVFTINISDITNLSHITLGVNVEMRTEACDCCGKEVPVGEMVYLGLGGVFYVIDEEETRIQNLYILACSQDCLAQEIIERLETQ